jgi:release factor glutamine methyltransferase
LNVDRTIAGALHWGAAALDAASESPRRDAEVLLQHCTGLQAGQILTHPQHPLDAAPWHGYRAAVARRRDGEPIAYITGRREFWSLPLRVSRAVLIPRADTETLVERALERLPAKRSGTVADLGTGCGAVALAIASERPGYRVVATDIDPDALAVAAANAAELGLANVEFVQGSWFEALAGCRFDLVVCNPPYVAEADPHLARGDTRFEPRRALRGGVDGLAAIRAIVARAPGALVPGGALLLEHGFDQADAVARLMAGAGFDHLRTYRDLGGHCRVTEGQI